MPKKLERKLRAQARKKGFGEERTERYVYGGMRNIGWVPSHQKKHRKNIKGMSEHDVIKMHEADTEIFDVSDMSSEPCRETWRGKGGEEGY